MPSAPLASPAPPAAHASPDGLERLGLARAGLSVPPAQARAATTLTLFLIIQPLVLAALLGAALLAGEASWWLAPLAAGRVALALRDVRADRVALARELAAAPRRLLELVVLCVLLLAAGGAQLDVVGVVALVPLMVGGATTPRRVAVLGVALLAVIVLAGLGDLLGDDGAQAARVVGASAALVVMTTVGGMLLAESRLRLSARTQRSDDGRRALMSEGLGLDARERHAAAEQLRAGARARIDTARDRLGATPADLVGARADVTAAVGSLRAVVRELHPAARRSRELAERLRAAVERRTGHAPTADIDHVTLAVADEELLLALVREIAEAAHRAGVREGAHLTLAGGEHETAVVLDLPMPPERLAAAWSTVVATATRMGGSASLAPGGHAGGTRVRAVVPSTAESRVEHLAGPHVQPRQLALVLAGCRLTYVALLLPFAALTRVFETTAAWWVAAGATAWMLGGIALAASPAWRRYPVGWRGSLPDIAWLAAGIAASGAAPRELGHLLPTLPLLYGWVFDRHGLRRLEVATWAAATVTVPVGLALGSGVLAEHVAAVGLTLALSCAVAELVAVGRQRLQERLLALEAERRGLLAGSLRAADAERRRLAFALHDGPLQTLLSVRQDLGEALITPSAEAPARALALLGTAAGELRAALEDDDPDGTAGILGERLEAVVRRARARAGLRTTLRADPGAAGLADDAVVALVRELVANVVRHAQASRLEVDVRCADGRVELEVRDDGRGIEPGRPAAAIGAGHVGLASCATVAEEAGGTLTLESPPGGGTTARASLPARAITPGSD